MVIKILNLKNFMIVIDMKKHFILLLIVSFITTGLFAQSPKWIRNRPVPENDTYLYVVEYATANNERDARNQAMAKVFQTTANRLGQPFNSSEINNALTKGTDYLVISKNYNIPINKVCEYTEVLANGYRVYVLCQVAKAGNKPARWTYFGDCGKISSNSMVAPSFIPGMAQIKKGQTAKGVCFIAGEIVFIGGAIVSHSMMQSNVNKINSTHNSSLKYQYTKNANTWMTMRNVTIAGAVAVYLWNVIDGIASKGEQHVLYGHNVTVAPYSDFNSAGIALNFKF